MRGDGADRVDDAWQMSDGSSALAANLDDVIVEHDLLAYAQRSAARAGAEWYAAEFRRRDEEEQRGPEPRSDAGLVDASAEDQLVGGAPSSLGFGPPPTIEPAIAVRHPHVPRPPAVEPVLQAKRGRRKRDRATAPQTFPGALTAPEWERMSPGARRLYGFDAAG
jgi:hypothetical protein